MLLTVTFALCELPYCKLYVAAEFVRKAHEFPRQFMEFQLLGFLGRVHVG